VALARLGFSSSSVAGRLYLWGYEYGYFPVELNDPDPSFSFKVHKIFDSPNIERVIPTLRASTPCGTSLPFSLLYPNTRSTEHYVTSAWHRVARSMPDSDAVTAADFFEFSRAFIDAHIPVAKAHTTNFYDWVEASTYPPGRKALLINIYRRLGRMEQHIVNKSFCKAEGYPKPKMARGINSYSDEVKVLIAAVTHDVDKALFSTKWFVKGTDPKTWPKRLATLFGDKPVMATDFTSFEAHHRGVFSDVVDYWFGKSTRSCNLNVTARATLSRLVRGTNIIKYKGVTCQVHQRLMSGAMWTSSSNGLLNLLTLCYLNARTLFPLESASDLAADPDRYFTGLIEGDDGICLDNHIPQTLIDKLGIILKPEHHPNFGTAAFCQNVCDVNGEGVIADPMKVLRGFFALPSRYASATDIKHRTLLRAKALSYAYKLNDCPIVGPLCHWIFRRTRSLSMSRWSSESYHDCAQRGADAKVWQHPPNITEESRQRMQDAYGIDKETQREIEDSLEEAGDLWVPPFDMASNAEETKYINHHVSLRPDVRLKFHPTHKHVKVNAAIAARKFQATVPLDIDLSYLRDYAHCIPSLPSLSWTAAHVGIR
jgi:hypothetical protein